MKFDIQDNIGSKCVHCDNHGSVTIQPGHGPKVVVAFDALGNLTIDVEGQLVYGESLKAFNTRSQPNKPTLWEQLDAIYKK